MKRCFFSDVLQSMDYYRELSILPFTYSNEIIFAVVFAWHYCQQSNNLGQLHLSQKKAGIIIKTLVIVIRLKGSAVASVL